MDHGRWLADGVFVQGRSRPARRLLRSSASTSEAKNAGASDRGQLTVAPMTEPMTSMKIEGGRMLHDILGYRARLSPPQPLPGFASPSIGTARKS